MSQDRSGYHVSQTGNSSGFNAYHHAVELGWQASQLLFVSQVSSFELVIDICQQALSNASVHDFLIIEYNGEIGGRVAHTTFGNSSAAKAYTVELGANWVRIILH
jgi:hypothetical protein